MFYKYVLVIICMYQNHVGLHSPFVCVLASVQAGKVDLAFLRGLKPSDYL